jgi:hypothetical protein
VDPVPDPLLLRKCGSAGNRTRTSGSGARNSGKLSSTPCPHIPSDYVLPSISETEFHRHTKLHARPFLNVLIFMFLDSRHQGRIFDCVIHKQKGTL